MGDAALYTWRESIHYVMRPKEIPVVKNSKAYYDKLTEELEAAAEEYFTKKEEDENRKEWWEE